MAVNVVAIIVLVIFYLAILVVGVVAAWKVKVKSKETGVTGGLETSLVAGRDLKTIVGVFTMIATTVGGGYINGTAESIARDGIVWTLAPLGIFIGLNMSGALFAKRMREQEYLTMLDPFQKHYGNVVTILVYFASLMGDLLWSASILNALGTTLSVIAGFELSTAVIMSGSVTIIYTTIGSMISVAYTDVAQLALIVVGLMLSLPFIFTNDNIGDLMDSRDVWLGQVDTDMWGVWGDLLVAMTLGTIPWQSYFQRVLSVRSAKQAQVLSFIGAFGAVVLVIPSVLIGMAGASADWTNTTLGSSPIGTNKSSLILPLVINEFTPAIVSVFGLGAISAAVMSSMDSAVLGTSSMFTHNIYEVMFRPKASKKELKIMHISAVIFFGCMCMLIALSSSVIYGMFILAADFVFVIIFPQLTALLYFPKYTNTVGSIAGFFFGLLLRVGAGESVINMPVWIFFPFYHSTKGQLFPFRSFAMITSFITIFAITFVTRLKYFKHIFKRCEQELCNEEQMGQLMKDTSGHLERENIAVNQDYPDQKSKHPALNSSEYTLTASSRTDFKSDVMSNGHFRKLDDRVI